LGQPLVDAGRRQLGDAAAWAALQKDVAMAKEEARETRRQLTSMETRLRAEVQAARAESTELLQQLLQHIVDAQ